MTPHDPGVLVVIGIDDPANIRRAVGKGQIPGSTDLATFMMPGEYHRLHLDLDKMRDGREPVLDGYHHIVNFITEAETAPKVLEMLRKLVRGTNAKIINAPEAVLRTTRDQVAKRMAGIEGLVVPKVHRLRVKNAIQAARSLEQAGMNYPIIVRSPGTHTGRSMMKLDNPDEVLAELHEPGVYLATEFVDFASADGIYRKSRIFHMNGRRIFRHRLASDHWNVHASDRERFVSVRPELIAEEAAFLEQTEGVLPQSVSDALDAVRARMGLDFFGVDFAILPDGRTLLFEANATMCFFSNFRDPRFPHLAKIVKPAGDAFRAMVGLPAIAIAPNAAAAFQE